MASAAGRLFKNRVHWRPGVAGVGGAGYEGGQSVGRHGRTATGLCCRQVVVEICILAAREWPALLLPAQATACCLQGLQSWTELLPDWGLSEAKAAPTAQGQEGLG